MSHRCYSKLSIFILVTSYFLFSQSSYAETRFEKIVEKTESVICHNEVVQFLDSEFIKFISVVRNKLKMAECLSFSRHESLGPLGEVIRKHVMSGSLPHLVNGSSDLLAVCPRYAQMSLSEKADVWTLIISSMSFYENSCRDTGDNPNATDGVGAGLLMLRKKDASGHFVREAGTGPLCMSNDNRHPLADDPQRTIVCGLSMLDLQFEKNHVLFDSHGYWQVLHPTRNNNIMKALRLYTPCGFASQRK